MDIIFTSLMIVILLLVCLYRLIKNKDYCEPIFVSSFYFILLFYFRYCYVKNYGSPFIGYDIKDPSMSKIIIRSILVIGLGQICFLLGYVFLKSKTSTRYINQYKGNIIWHKKRMGLSIWVLFLIGLLCEYIYIKSVGGIGVYLNYKVDVLTRSGGGYIKIGVSMLYLAGQIGYLGFLQTKNKKYLIVIATPIILGLLSGSKGTFLGYILSLMIIYNYIIRKIKMKWFLAFAVLALLLFPLFNEGRYGLSSLQYGFKQSYLPRIFYHHIMGRFHGYESVLKIIETVPSERDFYWGSTYLPIFISWIPRFLWETKPTISFGKIFAEEYFGNVYSGTGTSAAVTPIGEGYLNYGILGVIVECFFIGLIMRIFYERCVYKKRSSTGILIYAHFFSAFFMIWESNVAGFWPQRIVLLLLILIISKLMKRKGDFSDIHTNYI